MCSPRCTPHAATGFSLVEALVALALFGVAAGLLAGAMTVTVAARRRAELERHTSVAVHERIALLARRPCAAADTGGAPAAGATREWWSATRSGGAWVLVDSIATVGTAPRSAVRGEVACP
jgi:prepilin-type N-terminal cleavage/methylation domain-containing protein